MGTLVQRRRFTADEYQWMGRTCILSPDERVELLDGDVVLMNPIGDRHNAGVDKLTHLFSQRLGERIQLRVQGSFRLSEHSEPQPDVLLLRSRQDYYALSSAAPEDVLLVVEVADTSLDRDREVKLTLYAAAGIREAWIVNLHEMHVEVYRNPVGNAYQDVHYYSFDDVITPLAFPDVTLACEDILP